MERLHQSLIYSALAYFIVPHVEGPILHLNKVSRLDMGAYMCIAKNGVPPIISKLIHLNVDCKF